MADDLSARADRGAGAVVGTLLFLLGWWAGKLHGPYDTAIACALLSLDTQTALRWWLWRQSGR